MEKNVEKIEKILNKSIQVNDKASMIVSGGSSPTNLLHALNDLDIEWMKVKVMLLDERLVDENNKHSNQRYLKENFFKNHAKNAIYKSIRDLNIEKNIDLAILGFGSDGHFASIFPCHLNEKEFINLNEEPKILKTTKMGNPYVARLTMNLSAFLRVKNIFIIINSNKKLDTFHEAKDNKNLPIYHLLNLENINIEVIKDF